MAKGIGYLGDAQDIFYSAALAGAPDLPDDVVAWALEVSGRRPQSERITERVAEARTTERAARAERLKTDEKYRASEAERMKRLRNLPHSIPMSRALPAWPLGPQHEVDRHARQVFIETNAHVSLMKVRPKESAEILLGMLIEDNPEEEFGSGRIDIDLGLAYEHQSYPTVFFKSPYFAFLTTAPAEALGALIQLVNFCTERWIASVGRDRRINIPGVSLTLTDGSTKLFQGNRRVFGWAHFRSSKDGQLYSALNALERWLTFELEQGRGIATHVERILREGTSVAFLGVLVDVAKFRPALLGAELAPLLGPETLHWWDRDRQQERMNSFGWPSSGGLVDELAKEWNERAYRQQTFTEMLAHEVPRDAAIATLVKDAVSEWQAPEGDPQESLHFRVLCAELDAGNYSPAIDASTGEATFQMHYPEELQRAVLDYNHAVAGETQPLLLPYRCKQIIEQGGRLPDDQAALLYETWQSAGANADLSPEDKSKVAVAASAALLVCAPDWLAAKCDERTAAETTIRQLCSDEAVASSADEMRSARVHSMREDLTLGAHAVARQWIADPVSGTWDKEVLIILTSGDVRAVGVMVWLAHAHREKLGAGWWRLLELGLLWSALSMLGPDHGDPPELSARWERWLQRLRSFKLAGASSAEATIDVLAVAKAFARLKRDQWRRAYERESDTYFRRDPSDRHMPGLDTHFLEGLFGWLLDTRQAVSGPALEEQHRLIKQLWDYETAYLDDHRNDKGECQLPYQFGYDVSAKMAQLALILPAADAPKIWEAALRLGPDAHAVADHFAQAFWLQVSHGVENPTFERVWRGLVAFALDQPWYKGRGWYYGERTLRRLLGFGHRDSGLAAKGISASLSKMHDLFERWAKEHLRAEEENVGGLAHFLTTAGGASLRIEGMGWIATAISASPEGGRWYRENTNESLVGLLDTALANDAKVLTTNEEAREALMVIAADLTKRNVTAAFSLQERIRQLR